MHSGVYYRTGWTACNSQHRSYGTQGGMAASLCNIVVSDVEMGDMACAWVLPPFAGSCHSANGGVMGLVCFLYTIGVEMSHMSLP